MKWHLATGASTICQASAPSLADNYQDLQWNPAESGRGLNTIQQADVLVAIWLICGIAGRPLWLLGRAAMITASAWQVLPVRLAFPLLRRAVIDR